MGKGVGLLEDHAHALAQLDDVHLAGEDIGVTEADLAGDPNGVDQVVEAVDGTQERGFAASRGSDERGDLAVGDLHRHVKERLLLAVVEAEVVDREDVLLVVEGLVGGGAGGAGLGPRGARGGRRSKLRPTDTGAGPGAGARPATARAHRRVGSGAGPAWARRFGSRDLCSCFRFPQQ